eukprot:6001702-Pyramimonas_sp.AAC.2
MSGESSVRAPLHLRASTKSPAALAAQGSAIDARRACLVVLTSAARSSTYVGSSSPVMDAMALMRGSYP